MNAETTSIPELKDIFSNVLLVEDEKPHAMLVTRAMKGIVGEIVVAETGQDAIDKVQTTYFDLVLSDLNLPDAHGLEILETIRSIRPGLPVIVMTASDSLDTAVRAMRCGAWDYMVKQFDQGFQGRLELVLNRTAEQKLQQMRENELRAERNAFWASVNTAQDGLGILGAEGRVVFSNDAFRSFCALIENNGKERHSATFPKGLSIVDLVQGINPSVANSLDSQLNSRSSEAMWSSEVAVKIQDEGGGSSDKYFDLTLSTVRLETGPEISTDSAFEFRKHVLWVRDITRRKEQERFQRDLLSTTSHDLKGPLGAILTSAELLSDPSFAKTIQPSDIVTRIASCARNCITIIDEFLSARRIQDGVMVVKPQWNSVVDILEDMVLDYLPVAKAKQIVLQSHPVAPDLLVYADRIGLVRVLGNLVSNAIKFSSEGAEVTLSAERVNNEVQISVADTGPGIEASERHQLFVRYSRLEKHQTIEGTGLGLYVTKNIVEAHGGRIDVKSEVGRGTTFIVSLPDKSE